MIKKEWWLPLQSSCGSCAAETASLLSSHSLGVGKSFSSCKENILLTTGTNAMLIRKYLLNLRETSVEESVFSPVKTGSCARSCDYRYMPRSNGNAADDYAREQGLAFIVEIFVWKKLYIKISNNKNMKAQVLKGKLLLAAQKKLLFLFSVKHTTSRQFLADIIAVLTYILHMQCVC